MSLALYWTIVSQPSRAIKTLLLAGEVEHEDHELDHWAGDFKKPEYLAINPEGKVPCIVVDGKTMVESAAILRYLC